MAPKDLKTGAVIITGETARKQNANSVLATLSDMAGDFVVATAGPDLGFQPKDIIDFDTKFRPGEHGIRAVGKRSRSG